jgi:hypothetical protein
VNLEHELKDALKRQQPAPGLADRVMAAIDSRGTQRGAPSSWWRHRALQLAAAAVVIVAVGVGVARQQIADRERERGEAAARQLVTALRIASETLNEARAEISN